MRYLAPNMFLHQQGFLHKFGVHACPSPSYTNLFRHGASLRDGPLRR